MSAAGGERAVHRLRHHGEASFGPRCDGDLRGRVSHACARTVNWSVPPSQQLDVGAPFHNHWHVKEVILQETPIAGVRLYSYYDDGVTNTVAGSTARAISCSPIRRPATRSPSSTSTGPMPFAAPPPRSSRSNGLVRSAPRTLGLVGIGTMGENCLRCLTQLYRFRRDRLHLAPAGNAGGICTEMVGKLRIPVRTLDTIEEVVSAAPISPSAAPRRPTLSAASIGSSRARPSFAGAPRNGPRRLVEIRQGRHRRLGLQHDRPRVPQHDRRRRVQPRTAPCRHRRGRRRAEAGPERSDERILLHTTGMVSHDIGICWRIYRKARELGLGVQLPTAVAQAHLGPRD